VWYKQLNDIMCVVTIILIQHPVDYNVLKLLSSLLSRAYANMMTTNEYTFLKLDDLKDRPTPGQYGVPFNVTDHELSLIKDSVVLGSERTFFHSRHIGIRDELQNLEFFTTAARAHKNSWAVLLINQHIIPIGKVVNELFVPSPAIKRARVLEEGRETPAPRLVGIELNPGPPNDYENSNDEKKHWQPPPANYLHNKQYAQHTPVYSSSVLPHHDSIYTNKDFSPNPTPVHKQHKNNNKFKKPGAKKMQSQEWKAKHKQHEGKPVPKSIKASLNKDQKNNSEFSADGDTDDLSLDIPSDGQPPIEVPDPIDAILSEIKLIKAERELASLNRYSNAPVEPQDASNFRSITNKGDRKYAVRFEVHTSRPHLSAVGFLNHSMLATKDCPYYTKNFCLNYRSHDKTVALPQGLVSALRCHLVDARRDDITAFLVCVQKCERLTAELDLDDDQLLTAKMWAPLIAWEKQWPASQEISRLASSSYFDMRPGKLRSTFSSFGRFYVRHPTFCKVGLVTCSLFGFSLYRFLKPFVPLYSDIYIGQVNFARAMWYNTTCGTAMLWRFVNLYSVMALQTGANMFRYQYSPPAVRLVGIHVNPGPAVNYLDGYASRSLMINAVDLPGFVMPKVLRETAYLRYPKENHFNRRKLQNPTKVGYDQYIAFMTTGDYSPVCYASNLSNEEATIKSRVLAVTPEPCLAYIKRFSRWVLRNYDNLIGIRDVVSDTFTNYITNSNAAPGVKNKIIASKNELNRLSIDQWSRLSKAELYQYTIRGLFIKEENLLYRTPAGVKPKAARAIQSASGEFIALVGPFFSSAQRQLKRAWGKHNNIILSSGLTGQEMAQALQGGLGVILEDDVAKFDTSVCSELCRLEVALSKLMGAPTAVLDLMRANINTHGYSTCGFAYGMKGTRKSGDPYTSFFNSVLNGLMHVYIYACATGKSVVACRDSFVMVVQGDDNVMTYRTGPNIDWYGCMRKFGFDSEAKIKKSLHDVEFCSNRYYETTKGPIFAPKPGKVLAKLGYVIRPPAKVKSSQLLRGIALGLSKFCCFIPPIAAIINRILFLTRNEVAYESYTEDWQLLASLEPGECTPSLLCTLHDIYCWSSSIDREFQAFVSHVNIGDAYPRTFSYLLFDKDTDGKQVFY
jgi:hypothetical protein